MNKHTPGPWHANIDSNYATAVTNAEGIGIARVIGDDDIESRCKEHLVVIKPEAEV